ncbi:MAG: hypothetical protein LBJ02_04980 [Bifidobacteriaceae bacterium]|jgi:hypothetical protein|nr:hypothetical protein [Bifidobacteriaceae bacterium]
MASSNDHRRRAAAAALSLTFLSLVLTACLKQEAQITVNADDTLSSCLAYSYDVKEAKQMLSERENPMTLDEYLEKNNPEAVVKKFLEEQNGGSVQLEEFDDGAWAGWRVCPPDRVPLEEVQQYLSAGQSGMTISREGDEFVVANPAHSADEVAAWVDTLPPSTAEIVERAVIKVVFIFPGKVKSSTVGTIHGNEVSWQYSLKETEMPELRIVASAKPNLFLQHTAAVIIGGVAFVVVLIVVLVIVMRRRKRSRGSMDTAGGPPLDLPPISAGSGFSGQSFGADGSGMQGLSTVDSGDLPPSLAEAVAAVNSPPSEPTAGPLGQGLQPGAGFAVQPEPQQPGGFDSGFGGQVGPLGQGLQPGAGFPAQSEPQLPAGYDPPGFGGQVGPLGQGLQPDVGFPAQPEPQPPAGMWGSLEPQAPAGPQAPIEPQTPFQPPAGSQPQPSAGVWSRLEPQAPIEPQAGVQPQPPAGIWSRLEPQAPAGPQAPIEPQAGSQPQLPFGAQPVEEDAPRPLFPPVPGQAWGDQPDA